MYLIMKLSDNTVKVIQLSILILSLCTNTILFSLPIVFHFVTVSYQWYTIIDIVCISSLRLMKYLLQYQILQLETPPHAAMLILVGVN